MLQEHRPREVTGVAGPHAEFVNGVYRRSATDYNGKVLFYADRNLWLRHHKRGHWVFSTHKAMEQNDVRFHDCVAISSNVGCDSPLEAESWEAGGTPTLSFSLTFHLIIFCFKYI